MYSGYESDDADELMKWHNKRSHDILITIVESDFGNRIQKLRIYAGSDGQTDTSGLQMGALYFFHLKFTPHFNMQTCSFLRSQS
jgi:hypothetical protein